VGKNVMSAIKIPENPSSRKSHRSSFSFPLSTDMLISSMALARVKAPKATMSIRTVIPGHTQVKTTNAIAHTPFARKAHQ
jgi:hypothetical protein